MVGEYFVYHISIIGVHFAKPNVAGILPHVPVSPETLDQSVTKLSSSIGPFPPITAVDEGIAEWQRAQGGVFAIPVSQIVDIADQQLNKADLSH